MPKPTPKPTYLTVRTTRTDDPRIVLDEQDERHPGGYVRFAHDGASHQVAGTPRVRDLIAAGELEIVPPQPPAGGGQTGAAE